AGKNLSCHFTAAPLSCAEGITLPGYGCPVIGSRTTVAGVRASSSEKSPRRIFSVGRLGVTMVDCLWRSPSNVPKKKVLLWMMGPPTEAPKSLMMFCAFEGEKYGRAFSDAVVFIQNSRPCSAFVPDLVMTVALVTSPNSARLFTRSKRISLTDPSDGSANEFWTPNSGELALTPSIE